MDRSRVGTSSRAGRPAARRTPWCRGPTAPASSRSRSRARSSRSAAGGNGSPKARCSRSHQPAPTPQNARPPEITSRVATALAVMPGGRKVTGRDQRAEPQAGVEPGEQAERHPRLRDRLPGACRPAGSGSGGPSAPGPRSPASSAASATPAASRPGPRPRGSGRPAAPRRGPSRCSRTRLPARLDRRPVPPARRRLTPTTTRSQPSPSSARPAPAGTPRSCSVSTRAGTGRSRSALRRRHSVGRGVERDHDRGQSVPPGQVEPAPPAYGVQAERVDDGGQPASHPAGDDQVEQRERVRRGVQVVPTAADDAAQVVGGDDLGAAVALPAPRSTCRSRRRRRAPPAPGPAGAPRSWSESGRADGPPSL